jgi:hypothetical protein
MASPLEIYVININKYQQNLDGHFSINAQVLLLLAAAVAVAATEV